MWVRPLGQEDLLEEGIATHSSILAWRIPWTKKPVRLYSIGSQSNTRTQTIKKGSPLCSFMKVCFKFKNRFML